MKILIEQALNNLELAKMELNRPSEMVVTFTACKCAREAVIALLNSYLDFKKEKIQTDNSIEHLVLKCASIDPHFKALDLSCYVCGGDKRKKCESNYCLSITNANECYRTAVVVKEFIFAKLHLTEKRIFN